MAQQKKTVAPVIILPEPPPPPYIPRTPISESDLQNLYNKACSIWDEQCEYYGHDGDRPMHVVRRLQAILGAVDLETAQAAAKKAEEVMFMCLMNLLAKHRIPGPDDPLNWEKRGKNAQSLAKMLESKDDIAGARSQFIRAEECFAKAASLKKRKNEKLPLDKSPLDE